MKTHYVCARCGAYFDAYKNETTAEALVIPKLSGGEGNRSDSASSNSGSAAKLAATGDAAAPLVTVAIAGIALAIVGFAAHRRFSKYQRHQ